MQAKKRELAVCACGCGTIWERNGRGQRMRLFAPQCPRKRDDAVRPRSPCGCGQCGLTFVPGYKRQYAAGCPVVAAREAEAKTARHAARRAKQAAARAAAGLPPLKDCNGAKSGKRCRECEGLPHRRPIHGCACGLPYAPEPELRAQAVLASSAAMALR
jgi:hypothetical protein